MLGFKQTYLYKNGLRIIDQKIKEPWLLYQTLAR